MSLDTLLQHITEEGTPLSVNAFLDVSDLSPGELGRFARVWVRVSPERRQKVVEGLVEIAEDSSDLDFSAVFKLCLKDSDDTVRQKAITGLWELEDRSLIVSLVGMLSSDGSSQVRASAATALGKFASLARDGKILSRDGEQVKDCLMKALQDSEECIHVRRRALESVAPFDSPELHGYIQWAYNTEDLELKGSSLYAMGRTGQRQWLPLLLRELQSVRPPLRYEAASACGEMDEEETAPYLIPLLQDEDLQVQLATIGSLGKIGGPLAKRGLRRCLKNGDPALEDAAREALEDIQATEDPLGFSYEV